MDRMSQDKHAQHKQENKAAFDLLHSRYRKSPGIAKTASTVERPLETAF
jgi:hypothetical protein